MKEKINEFISKFNLAWTQGNPDDIMPLLHNDAILLAPDLKTEVTGKDACLQTIKDYISNAKTKSFHFVNSKINIWQNTAVVSVNCHIVYEMNNQTYKEAGKEFWTMSNHNNKWQLVWRAMAGNERID